MASDVWAEMAARLTTQQPVDLDDPIAAESGAAPDPGGCVRRELGEHWIPPAQSVWATAESDRVAIGVRVNGDLKGRVEIAARLIAMACERGVMPVIFSTCPESGFERFGFRVERVAGADASQRAACEEELKRFWDIAVVVDAEQINRLR
ncbi:MAG: hypothetical protein ACE5FS_07345 [Paracoccaceae bacterium]